MLLGFIVSAGGLTESTMKAASDSLLGYVAEIKDSEQDMDGFLGCLVRVLEENKRKERVIGPFLVALDQILSCGYLDIYLGRADDCPSLAILLQTTIDVGGQIN